MENFLGQNIKLLRIRYGWTQSDLGDILGVSTPRVSGYERGKFEPNIDSLKKLGQLFNVSLDDLVNKDLSNQHVSPSSDALERIEARLREVEAQLSDRPEDPEQVRRLEALADRLVKEYPEVAKKLGLDIN